MLIPSLLRQIAEDLKRKNIKVATAESCTAGLIAYWLTKIPGSSRYFSLGLIPYQNIDKHRILHIPQALLDKYKGVSPAIARKMAEAIKKISRADIGLSVTGFAGPAGGTKTAPCGTVYIGISSAQKTFVHKFSFSGGREAVRRKAAQQALHMLKEAINRL